jgi:hypothetical protein
MQRCKPKMISNCQRKNHCLFIDVEGEKYIATEQTWDPSQNTEAGVLYGNPEFHVCHPLPMKDIFGKERR